MSYYSDNAEALFERYNSADPAKLHADWLKHLPERPGVACDIGAGTGRDANWLAEKGWDVIAVEPEAAFREHAKDQSHPNVSWLDDKLPELNRLRKLNQRFNLILLSGVWMHLPEKQRRRAFRILTELLNPGGILVISLRHSSDAEEVRSRRHYEVSVEELEHLARERAVAVKAVSERSDGLGRDHVYWETAVLEVPDDGTGSLPLLRHIIVNDDKSATYKLGLLRTILRIADGAPGMVIRQSDTHVEIPFGLVGLYWIRLYMPLLKESFVQAPTHRPEEQRGLGFARSHFYQLQDRSPYDLRVGASFSPDWAAVVISAIRDACNNIQQMPATYITYPGQDKPVFQCAREPVRHRRGTHWRIDKESLAAFGIFRVPKSLWQCFCQYACWVEPAILNEWVRLMETYNIQYDRSVYDRAFLWEGDKRSTAQVRQIAEQLLESQNLSCVWTGQRLQGQNYHVDHCFPWSRWFNNDLWNLMPASVRANSQKAEKLPGAALMHESRDRILEWWDSAYGNVSLGEQFRIEAEAALPLVAETGASLDSVFDAILHQRARLKVDQQLEEWLPRCKAG
jgi:SAM-dependent methyltransferase